MSSRGGSKHKHAQAAPTTGAVGGGDGDEARRSSKRPKPTPAPLERRRTAASEVLFLLLERQRHAAREARAAAHEAEGIGPSVPFWDRLRGGDDDDGEASAVVGAGWWREPVRFLDDYNGGLREASFTAKQGPAPLPPEDVLFFETCASAARVCKEWRALAFAACDRAVLSWEGKHVYANDDMIFWRASPVDKGAKPLDPVVERLRAFDGGVLRALVVRGEPPPVAAGRLRAVARSAAVEGKEPGIVRVLQGLRVLRLERSTALLATLAPLRCGWPRAQRPLLASLVTLDAERWPDDGAPFAITRAHFPSLRTLKVSLDQNATQPFDLWGKGRRPRRRHDDDDEDDHEDDADLPPALTRLLVDVADFEYPKFEWASGHQALLVSQETLTAVAPTLRCLRSARGDWPGRATVHREVSRLQPFLSSLTRLSKLSLDGGYDWSPSSSRYGPWLRASRALFARFPDLRELELTDPPANSGFVVLPPSLSLLTRLTSLQLQHYFVKSVGSGLRRLTGLERLVVKQYENGVDDDSEDGDDEDDDGYVRHPPLLGRDLEGLSSLTCLQMTYSARCHAAAIESGLPRLSSLAISDFVRPVAEAARARLARSGGALAVCTFPSNDFSAAPTAMTLEDLDAKIAQFSGHDDAEDAQEHEQRHQTLQAKVDSLEELDAREA